MFTPPFFIPEYRSLNPGFDVTNQAAPGIALPAAESDPLTGTRFREDDSLTKSYRVPGGTSLTFADILAGLDKTKVVAVVVSFQAIPPSPSNVDSYFFDNQNPAQNIGLRFEAKIGAGASFRASRLELIDLDGTLTDAISISNLIVPANEMGLLQIRIGLKN